ncbi:hypothetical protein A200_07553 [Parascardovia denticolens IPLA 20019]|uniref:helix-turn-helix transcriptional regulator n=1 Tax=Parascardovia denticolens TaxID=78258 RepID=UPI0002669866|nr:AlpA family phage regulatory protein [Parascardovia denticolens]EIT87762.1 hypothetical protein A200_07553 [Parascardovia denticolens IPLA 20019]
MERLLSARDVSEWTGLTVGHLAQLRYVGKGPRYIRLSSRRVAYRLKDVQAWLEACTVPTRM